MFSICCKRCLANGSPAVYSSLSTDWICFVCLFSQIPHPTPAPNRIQSAKETCFKWKVKSGPPSWWWYWHGPQILPSESSPSRTCVASLLSSHPGCLPASHMFCIAFACAGPSLPGYVRFILQGSASASLPLEVLPRPLPTLETGFLPLLFSPGICPARCSEPPPADFSPFTGGVHGPVRESGRALSPTVSHLRISFKRPPSSVTDIHLCSCLVSVTYTKI